MVKSLCWPYSTGLAASNEFEQEKRERNQSNMRNNYESVDKLRSEFSY